MPWLSGPCRSAGQFACVFLGFRIVRTLFRVDSHTMHSRSDSYGKSLRTIRTLRKQTNAAVCNPVASVPAFGESALTKAATELGLCLNIFATSFGPSPVAVVQVAGMCLASVAGNAAVLNKLSEHVHI